MNNQLTSFGRRIFQNNICNGIVANCKNSYNSYVDFWKDVFNNPSKETKLKLEVNTNVYVALGLSLMVHFFYVGPQADTGDIDLGSAGGAGWAALVFVGINVIRSYIFRRIFAMIWKSSQCHAKSFLEGLLNGSISWILSIFSFTVLIDPFINWVGVSFGSVPVTICVTAWFTILSYWRVYILRVSFDMWEQLGMRKMVKNTGKRIVIKAIRLQRYCLVRYNIFLENCTKLKNFLIRAKSIAEKSKPDWEDI